MEVLRDGRPADPAADMARSEALLRAVAAGRSPAVARVFRPGPTVAFGRRDALVPGFPAAQEAAREAGFTPVVRLGGGHAAAYHEGSVILELITPQASIGVGTDVRFAAAAAVLVSALEAVGVVAVVGELPGEYCPGRWSVHGTDAPVKLAGLAQRAVRGAALTTGFVVVEGGARVRGVLTAVYAALGIAWDPATAGAAEDLRPGVRAADLEAALAEALADRGR